MLRKDRTRPKRKANRTRTHPNGPTPIEVKDYRHKGEKRKNIPDAGLATYNYKPQVRVKYSYDAHLDPHLVWSGKAERTSFEVETVSLHIHERVSTQAILETVKRSEQLRQLKLFAEPDLPFDKRIEFYQHEMDWANRLILGDSLLVMNSLKERELMEGKVQMIYMDPPYGIKYASNFQPRINKRDVKDTDEDLTREPEQIQAYRDTWELGIHSYLTYLRDRLLLCRDLLHNSGSIFVQISDENLHHVRELMDEIFGAQNFVSVITFRKKTMPLGARFIESVSDFIIWYAKEKTNATYHQLFLGKNVEGDTHWDSVELPDRTRRKMIPEEISNHRLLPKGSVVYRLKSLYPVGINKSGLFSVAFHGKTYNPPPGQSWLTNEEGMERLISARRVEPYMGGQTLQYVLKLSDYDVTPLTALWADASAPTQMRFVVETNVNVVMRCILMTTNPGDLVLDPTCGSGTTAFVAEQFGRCWITCDTSRVALAIARERLMTARFDYYKLANPEKGIDAGFIYRPVPHITLGSIAQNEEPETEILYDKPLVEDDKVRVSGPFTVEAIPAPAALLEQVLKPTQPSTTVIGDYVNLILDLLRKSSVTFPGGKQMTIENLRPTDSAGFVHAEGETAQNGGKIRVAISLGPRYGPITAKQVDEAIRSSYKMGFDVLIFAGFAFDPEAQATIQKNPIPKLRVQMAHISPDVIVGAYSDSPLLKTTKTSQLFTVFGEPDVKLEKNKDRFTVRLHGVDLYDPTTGQVHSSNADEIPAWFLDEDYDGYTFRICQAFFPKEATAKNPWDKLENALRGLVDKEKMEKFRGTESLPFKVGPQRQISVKVIDIRGNEVMVVKSLGEKEQI